MKIISIEPLSDYQLKITFDDEVSGTIDLNEFVKNGIFAVLQDLATFNTVYTNGYSVAWNDDLEIDALSIYAELLNKTPEEVFTTNFSYATN